MTETSPYPSLRDYALTFADREAGQPPAWLHGDGDPLLRALDTLGLRYRLEDVLDTVVALQRSEWLQEGVYAGPRALPELYRDVLHCARTLGVAVPPVIVSGALVQGAFGTDARAYLHLSSLLTSSADRPVRRFVVGRLCGRVAARHVTPATLYALLVDHGGLRRVARQGLGPTLEFVLAPMSVGVRLTLSRWHRASEISADRAGLLCCASPGAAREALLRLALGTSPGLDPEAYLDQLSAAREGDSPGRWAEILASRPWMHKRMQALALYARSRDWVDQGHEPAGEPVIDREELDRRTARLLEVG